jgi:predicted acylesterase/phospholipase RssA
MARPLTVLALDGGGIRGVIPAMVLAEIERRTRARIAELFDLIAGTSTGGILALLLAKPARGGKPQFAASDVVELYEKEGRRIFDRSLWHRFIALENLLDEKYPADGLEAVLDRYFGGAMLSQAATEVLVTAYELETREPWFFARWKARDATRKGWDFPMKDIARATSAAPTYFEPYELERTRPPGGLVDGGIFANNPAMCGWVEARKLHPETDDVLVVSLGTGQHTRPIHYKDAKTWGLAKWAQPVLACVFDGVSDTVDHQMQAVCVDGPDGKPRYYRYQTELDSAMDDMDNATRTNILALERKAQELIADADAELDRLSAQLLSRARARVAPTGGRARSVGTTVPRSVRPEDLAADPDEFDPFFDDEPDPIPRAEGDDSIHAEVR